MLKPESMTCTTRRVPQLFELQPFTTIATSEIRQLELVESSGFADQGKRTADTRYARTCVNFYTYTKGMSVGYMAQVYVGIYICICRGWSTRIHLEKQPMSGSTEDSEQLYYLLPVVSVRLLVEGRQVHRTSAAQLPSSLRRIIVLSLPCIV